MSRDLASAADNGAAKIKNSKKRTHPDSTPSHDASAPKKARKDQASDIPYSTSIKKAPGSQSSDSPFHTQRSAVYLPLSPIGQSRPLESLCAEHLSPLLLTYYHPLRGVLLSYSDVTLSTDPPSTKDQPAVVKAHGEYGPPYAWLIATFTLFKPSRDTLLEGYINVTSSSHIGLICYNLFNASIERAHLPRKWEWKAPHSTADTASGYWQDDEGDIVDEDKPLSFRVRDFESIGFGGAATARERAGFLTIKGTLLNDEELETLAGMTGIRSARKVTKNREHSSSVPQGKETEAREQNTLSNNGQPKKRKSKGVDAKDSRVKS